MHLVCLKEFPLKICSESLHILIIIFDNFNRHANVVALLLLLPRRPWTVCGSGGVFVQH